MELLSSSDDGGGAAAASGSGTRTSRWTPQQDNIFASLVVKCVADCAGKPNFNLGDLLVAEAQKHSVALGRTMSSQQALGRLDYMKRGCQAVYAYHKALTAGRADTAAAGRVGGKAKGAIKRTAAVLAGLNGTQTQLHDRLQGPLLQLQMRQQHSQLQPQQPLWQPQHQQPQQQQPQQLPLRVFAPGAGNQAEASAAAVAMSSAAAVAMSSAWSTQLGVAEHGLGVSWQGYMQSSLGGASGGSPLAPITPGASLSQGYVPGTQADFAYIEKHLFPSNPSSEV
ncbi:hypothetical protein QJQ45_000743 [Haematococcus lacustris]|nr:hypothetical protein QJQ45_000743 [Haematococcus lacustris]